MSDGAFWGAAGQSAGWGLAAATGAGVAGSLGLRGLDRWVHAGALAVVALLAVQMLLLLAGLYGGPALILGLALLLLASRRIRSQEPASAADTRDPHGAAVLAGALLVWLGFAADTWTAIPARADALAYHAPMAVQWLQHGSLWVDDARAWFYPGNAELLLASSFALAGSDALAGSVDAVLFGLLAATAVGLVRRAGHDPPTACAGGLAAVASPLLLSRLGALDADLLLALASLWVLYFAWSARELERPALARVLFFASLGALAGTKYLGAAHALLLGSAGLALGGRRLWSGREAALGAALGLVLCAPFYARNLWLAGAPFYPAGLWGTGDTAQLVATARPVSAAELARSALLTHPEWGRALRLAAAHLLPGALPQLVLAALVLVSPSRALAAPVCWLLLAAACAWLLFGLAPLGAENVPGTLNQVSTGQSWRFGLTALLLSAIAGLAACRSGEALRVWCQLCVAATALFWAWAGHVAGALTVAAGLACWRVPRLAAQLARGAAGLRARLPGPLAPALAAGLAALAVGAAAWLAAPTREAQRQQLASLGGRTAVVDWLAGEPCARSVALTVGARAYPLLGRGWQRRVVAIGMHPVSARDWRTRLERPEIDFVVVMRELGDPASASFGEFPPLDAWLTVRPESFERVYTDAMARVYATAAGRACRAG
jgi:hypothetical protein